MKIALLTLFLLICGYAQSQTNSIVTEKYLADNLYAKPGITPGSNDTLGMDCDQILARYTVSISGITSTGHRLPSQNQLSYLYRICDGSVADMGQDSLNIKITDSSVGAIALGLQMDLSRSCSFMVYHGTNLVISTEALSGQSYLSGNSGQEFANPYFIYDGSPPYYITIKPDNNDWNHIHTYCPIVSSLDTYYTKNVEESLTLCFKITPPTLGGKSSYTIKCVDTISNVNVTIDSASLSTYSISSIWAETSINAPFTHTFSVNSVAGFIIVSIRIPFTSGAGSYKVY